jgi:hypothetical protein
MKHIVWLIILLSVTWGVQLAAAQAETPSAVYIALADLNQYLFAPLTLHDEGFEWDWSVITVDDLGQDCRARTNTEVVLPTIVYDIQFYRNTTTYHYRVTTDEQLILRCVPLVAVPPDTLPQVSDALSDLSRRLHLTLSPQDLRWQWREVQFDDYTLDCPESAPLEETFDQKINGYQIEFTILGRQWDYRVSADRLIVILCEE